MAERVFVTGYGCVSGLGQGAEESWRRALAGEGAIVPIARSRGEHPALGFEGPAAPVGALDLAKLEARAGRRAVGNLDPVSLFAALAAGEALEHAGLVDHPSLQHRTTILFGSGSGGNATFEDGFQRIFERKAGAIHPLTIPKAMLSAPAAQLSMLYGVRGLSLALSSACASSAHALGEAMHMIRAGRCDVAIAGGGEACLTLGSWLGWKALRTMAPDTCRPFSRDRRGLVLGEGAAILVLESERHARERGAEVYAELAGLGVSSDAGHLTAPDPRGAEAALRSAHADAGLPLDALALISSHGTGTVLNDRSESEAMRAVYGAEMAGKRVIATKSAHGHLIGAAGAMEFLLGIMALEGGWAPPVLNWSGPDPDCDVPLALEPTRLDGEALVSNSFAFGGMNAVLIARRV